MNRHRIEPPHKQRDYTLIHFNGFLNALFDKKKKKSITKPVLLNFFNVAWLVHSTHKFIRDEKERKKKKTDGMGMRWDDCNWKQLTNCLYGDFPMSTL